MDMSALDKSLDEIIKENKGGSGRGRGRGRGGGRGRGRSRGRGTPRARGGSFKRGRGRGRGISRGRTRGGGRGGHREHAGAAFKRGKFDRPRTMKKIGRGRGRANFKASPMRNKFNAKPLRRPSGSNNSFMTQGKVVVSNLKKHVSSDDIKEIFEKFGTVTQAYVKFDANSGASTGIAEVFYSRGAEAREAQKQLDGAKIDDGVIRVRLAIPSNFQPKGRGRGSARGAFRARRGGRFGSMARGQRRPPMNSNTNNNSNPLRR